MSPSLMLFSKRLRPRCRLASPLQTTIRARKPDLQHELFPLHSPLLGESWLVSFPPLSYMLKFSGSSCLIGGPNESSKTRSTVAGTARREDNDSVTNGPSPHIDRAESRRNPVKGTGAVNSSARRRPQTGESFVHNIRCTRSARPNTRGRAGSSGTRIVRSPPLTAPFYGRMKGDGRVVSTDTPTSMLPGISRKRKMRSKF